MTVRLELIDNARLKLVKTLGEIPEDTDLFTVLTIAEVRIRLLSDELDMMIMALAMARNYIELPKSDPKVTVAYDQYLKALMPIEKRLPDE